ncbi:MAG: ribonuclease activity regulator RraA [Acetobacteraceae bacterium]|nr:ribonuclease activity regulator RraA [Acetobacteraceae bacterium]MCX7683715.1 ribonuclease activity regulator RraA [Acetobacteraceae bacterium]MDW8398613.1 ribonuclease activity regulator RraA [Acetobacteraceae bacterium]
MRPETRTKLAAVSTATLTTVLFKRGLRNVFLQGLRPVGDAAPRMVGPAYTMRTIPAREDLDTLEVFADPANIQRRGIEECPAGCVLVVDSRGDASAASGGAILLRRLMARGAAGAVTDGGFRDSPDIARLPFPAYHRRPAAPTNLIRHHPVGLQEPIACGGVAVFPGDVMVGDGEGVVCIPAHLADEVAEEAFEQTVYEDFVEERVAAGHSIRGLYPMTDPANRPLFEAWRRERNR